MKPFGGGVEWPGAMVVTAWKLEEARVRKRWNFEKRFPIVKQLKEVLIFLFWRTLLSYFLVFVFLLIIYALLRLYLNPGDPDAVWVGSFIAGHALFFSFVFVSLWYVQFRRLRINMAADAMGRISTFLQDHEKTAGELRLTFIAGLKLDLSDPASKIRFLSYIEALGKMLQLAEDGGVTPKAVRSFFEGQILDLLRSTDIVSEFFATEDDVKRLWLPERSNFIRLVMLMTEGGRGDRGFWDYLAVPFMNGEPFVRVFCQVAQMMSSLPPTLRLKDRYFNSFLLKSCDTPATTSRVESGKSTAEGVETSIRVFFDTSNSLKDLRAYFLENSSGDEVTEYASSKWAFTRKSGSIIRERDEDMIHVWETLRFGTKTENGVATLVMRQVRSSSDRKISATPLNFTIAAAVENCKEREQERELEKEQDPEQSEDQDRATPSPDRESDNASQGLEDSHPIVMERHESVVPSRARQRGLIRFHFLARVDPWKDEEALIRKRWNMAQKFPFVRRLKSIWAWTWWRVLLIYYGTFSIVVILYCAWHVAQNPNQPDTAWLANIAAVNAMLFTFITVSFWFTAIKKIGRDMAAAFLTRMFAILKQHSETESELRATFLAGKPLDLSSHAQKQKLMSYIEAMGRLYVLGRDGGVPTATLRLFFGGQVMDLLRSKEIVSEFFATEDDVKRLWLPERSNFIRLVMLMTEGGRGDRGFWDYLAVPFMNGEPFVRVFCQVAQMMSSLPPTLRLKDRYFNSFLLRVSDQQAVVHFDTSNTLGELRRYLAESTDPEIEVLTPGTPSLSFMKKTGNAVVKSKDESHIFVWECLQFGLINVQGGIAVLQMRSNGKHFLEQQGKKKSSVGAALEDVNPEYRSDTIMDDKGNENEKLVTD